MIQVILNRSGVQELEARSMNLFPNSDNMRRQWLEKTIELLDSDRHGLLTGGWANGIRGQLDR